MIVRMRTKGMAAAGGFALRLILASEGGEVDTSCRADRPRPYFCSPPASIRRTVKPHCVIASATANQLCARTVAASNLGTP